jgi:hypothetical protein
LRSHRQNSVITRVIGLLHVVGRDTWQAVCGSRE